MSRASEYPILWDSVFLSKDRYPCVSDADGLKDDMVFCTALNKDAGPRCAAVDDAVAGFSIPDPEDEVPFPSLKCGNCFNVCPFL